MPEVFHFRGFELDAAAYELRRGARVVKMERLAMELLFLLVSRRNTLVTREQIADKLWGDTVHVDAENGVNTAIRKVRRALGDQSDRPKFIQTVPGKGYRFIAEVRDDGPARALSAPVKIAVLPFVNLTGDDSQHYFCDGMTEETIANLGAISPEQIGVIARTSSMAYRSTKKPIKRIGEELGVDYVLESSIRREGSRVRVAVQLIRANDQLHVWAHCYDRDSSSLIDIQAELGRAIASRVNANLPEGGPRERRQTGDPDAFDLYLRGRFCFAERTPPSIKRAIDFYAQALKIDPKYALAEAGMADAYATLPITSDYRIADCEAKGMRAAERSVALDGASAEAHSALAACCFWLTWDWERAIEEALRAIELNPSYSLAYFYQAHTLSNLRRHREAEEAMRKAKSLDPFSVHVRAIHGQMLFQAGRYEDARAEANSALALNGNSWLGHVVLAKVDIEKGSFEDAIQHAERSFQSSGGNTEPLSLKAFALARSGNRSGAEEVLRVLKETARSRYVPAYNLAMVYNGLGKREKAIELLGQAARDRDVRMIYLAIDPKWKEVSDDPRVRELWPAAQK